METTFMGFLLTLVLLGLAFISFGMHEVHSTLKEILEELRENQRQEKASPVGLRPKEEDDEENDS